MVFKNRKEDLRPKSFLAMHPILFKIGPLVIHSYGVLAATAFLVGGGFVFRLARKENISGELILDLLTLGLISGLLGARLFWVVLFSEEISYWWEIFTIWKGGQVFYGGIIFSLLIGILYLRKKKANLWKIADLFGVGIPLAFSVARWGCVCAGCCYGKPTDVSWGITFTNLLSLAPLNVKLHPTQIYHSLHNFLIFLLLWAILGRKKFDGEVFWLYLLFYPIGRFIIEFWRGDYPEVLFGLDNPQVISLYIIPIAIVGLWECKRKFQLLKRE